MDDMGVRLRQVPYLLLLLLVVLLAVAGGLVWYGKRVEQQRVSQAPSATPYVIQVPKTVAVNSPITKQVHADGLSARYSIRGVFTVPPEQQNTLNGKFSISGDPKRRTMLVLLGSTRKIVMVGRFTGSFAGTSLWEWISYEELLPLISSGQEVELRFDLELDPQRTSFPMFQKLEQQLDELITEFVSGKFTSDLPNMRRLAISAVGVVQ